MAQAPGNPPPPPYVSGSGGPPPYVPQGAGGRITERASFWQRLVASIADGLLLGAVGFVISALLGDPGFYDRSGTGSGLNFILGIAYYVYFHGSASGQTLGKKAMKIRVLGFQDGTSIGYGRAALRYLGTILSAIPCGLGYLWMLWDREKQTWHDKIASTIVVPESAAPVEKWPG